MDTYKKVLTHESLSENIRKFKNAVRGPLTIKAEEYEKQLALGNKLPFPDVLYLNLGNPLMLNQAPISFLRQVLACILDSSLIERKIYHDDIAKRAKKYIGQITNIGAYGPSQGYKFVRVRIPFINILKESVARFIEKRDGFTCDPDSIFLTNGAVEGVQIALKCLITAKNDCILTSVPRFTAYPAEIQLKGGTMFEYFLDEDKNWELTINELERSYNEAVSKGLNPKAIVIINPGNPTGAILSKKNIEDICVKFTYEKNIAIIADEVYQSNIYDEKKIFYSFKQVISGLGDPYCKNQEVISLHSISKGVLGECGQRGGYMELFNIEDKVREEILKLKSVSPSTVGQIFIELMVNPPTLEDCSKETVDEYNKEVNGLLDSLKKRAKISTEYLRKMTNVTTNEIEGAMYAFPQIKFSKSACEAAEKLRMKVDEMYCFNALDETGIVMVPGSGFGQVEGTYHFRITTLLFPESKTEEAMKRLHEFNEAFHKKYP